MSTAVAANSTAAASGAYDAEVQKRKELELDEESVGSEEDGHVYRLLRELLCLNAELLSAEDMAALAPTSKAILALKRAANPALKGTPMQLCGVLTMAHFPTVQRLSLILDKTPNPT